jgi:hypothetical protein
MRGRLIFPFYAEIARLDTAATAADPDGAGSRTSGYDPVFREPVRLTGGVSARVEKAPILVPCQVEDRLFEALQQAASGDAPNTAFTLTFHFRDLEFAGLVDAVTGDALIRKNDRIVSIRRKRDSALVQAVSPTRGGMYVVEATPAGFGLSGGERNLLLVRLEERAQGYR